MDKLIVYTPFETTKMIGSRFYEQHVVDQRIAELEATVKKLLNKREEHSNG